jgi:hypothetical protein
MNTTDKETGSPRRKGGLGQLSSVKKGKWSRRNEGWNGRAADGTALDTGVVSLFFSFIFFSLLITTKVNRLSYSSHSLHLDE